MFAFAASSRYRRPADERRETFVTFCGGGGYTKPCGRSSVAGRWQSGQAREAACRRARVPRSFHAAAPRQSAGVEVPFSRVAVGDVRWPRDNGHPRAFTPHGVDHHYAPLATADPKAMKLVDSFRRHFESLARP
jgi:hypothetical protein